MEISKVRNIFFSFLPLVINFNNNTNLTSKKIGRWTQEEHFSFIKGCLIFGKNWNKVRF